MRLRRHAVAGLGAVAGVHAWLATGVFAPAEGGGLAGLLPSPWLLWPLMVAGGVAAWRCWPNTWPVALLALPVLSSVGWVTGAMWPGTALWAGALAVLPWLWMAGALVLHWVERLPPRVDPSARPRGLARLHGPLGAAIAGAAWMALVAIGLGPAFFTGDEPHYLLIGESLLRDGDLDLRNNYDERHYAPFYAGDLEPRHVVSGWLGEEFPFHAPGAGLLAVPALALGDATFVRAWLVLLSAVTLGVAWSTAFRLTGSAAAAWMGWAALALPAPLAIHGSRLYPDAPAALAVATALWLLVRLQRRDVLPATALVAVGGALTTLPWLHLRLAMVAGVLGLAVVVALRNQPDRWSARAVFLAVPVIGATLWLAVTWRMFHVLDPTAAFRARDAGRPWSELPMGIVGMLADQEFGLLPYAPLLACALPGLGVLWRLAPTVAASGAGVVALTLTLGGTFAWWGGTSAPARFLVPVLPAATLAVSAWWAAAAPAHRAIGQVLAGLGAAATLAAAFARGGSLATNAPDGRGTIFEWLSAHVDVSLALPSLFREGTTAPADVGVLVIWIALGLAWAWTNGRVAAGRDATVAARFGLAAVGGALWLSTSVALSWAWRGTAIATPARATLELIQAAPAPRLVTGIATAPWAFASRDEAISRLVLRPGRATDADTPLDVPNLPEGRYLVMVDGPEGADRRDWHVEVGRDAWPLAGWSPAAAETATVALALPVRRLRVVGPPADAWLRPLALPARRVAPPFEAWRVHRWGGRQVHERDGLADLDPGGLWLRGDRTAEMLVTDLEGRSVPVALGLEAGPAAVRVRLEQGSWTAEVELAAGEPRRVDVPAPAIDGTNVIPLRVDVRGGFRADALHPGRRDERLLGVFVSFGGWGQVR